MKYRVHSTVAAALLAVALAACGGAGGTNPPIGGGGSGLSAQSQSEMSISTANALGSPMKNIADDNNAISAQSQGIRTESGGQGTCTNYSEFFAPDKNGDANSTERQFFYDAGCTELARDTVRIFTSTGSSSETVANTEKLYAVNNATPIATRTATNTIANATFDANGFPKAANGFDRIDTGNLALGGVKTIDSDAEMVMQPASGGINQYCGDSAGFNATGFAALGETFGWNGGISGVGTRTVNVDRSITWSATHAGTNFKGAIGALSIATGAPNTACPISTPMFTLAGGTSTGTYSIPITATYANGLLENLSIANAQLANGNTLNVSTNTSVPPTNSLFITGTIANGSTQISTFNVDAYGDGTLTITASGTQYVIDDWHVVK
ncbi:MAG TPA: hypothetical protein VMS32_00485 [Verrucomicrobiae bacterium]|jgi:hypothetical protein|nr:hypothetical protein [Verrucomicrobiae bacterium]